MKDKKKYCHDSNIYLNIAVSNQSDFNETYFDNQFIESDIGTVWDTKCNFCGAYKFFNETNFCCSSGLVNFESVKPLPEPSEEYKKLYSSKKIISNLKAYNSALSLTSIGCKTPENVEGPNFKIQGEIYHRLGSLLPSDESSPKFSQIYFYDAEVATYERMKIFPNLDENVLKTFHQILSEINSYVKSYKVALELQKNFQNVKIFLIDDQEKIPKTDHSGRYNLPNGCEVAALLDDEPTGNYDILIESKSDNLKRIHSLSRFSDPMHYVLLFPFGNDGYSLNLKRSNGKQLSLVDFYSFRLQLRDGFNLLSRSGRLFQQYIVDAGSKIEKSRTNWALLNQKTIKAEKYQGLLDAAHSDDMKNSGKKIILPPTITGSPRWYVDKFHDAMSIVEKIGKPHIFLTFTTNPKWPEIVKSINPLDSPYDRPDILTRVFKLKLDNLLHDIEEKFIFGICAGFVATIEQQKRKGLHHAHILIILNEKSAPKTGNDIDKLVSAEIPDPNRNPKLYSIILNHNIHGPCGLFNKQAPCMEFSEGKLVCSKNFPKPYIDETILNPYDYPEYRRRSPLNGGRTVTKYCYNRKLEFDNGYVVPYNSYLSLKYDCHINVEIVCSIISVKYIYKYITKGPDRCIVKTGAVENQNEITEFLNMRYLGASECCLKIFKIPFHYRSHPVLKLACHLPNEQIICFEEGEEEEILKNGAPETKLTAYFDKNKADPSARQFLYTEFPGQFLWQNNKWADRKNVGLKGKTIGRIPTVGLNTKQLELYCLRLLLINRRGSTSFEDLRTVDNVLFPSYQSACIELGIFHDDSEIEKSLIEAGNFTFGDSYIEFFTSILEFCKPNNSLCLWNKFKDQIALEISNIKNISLDDSLNYILKKIRNQLNENNLELSDFNLPEPVCEVIHERIIFSQTDFNKEYLKECYEKSYSSLLEHQKSFFHSVIDSVENQSKKIFALNALGGTGKTYILNCITDYLRYKDYIVLSTAASGVASTLLHKGSTTHGRFKVPLHCHPHTTCNFGKNDQTGKLLSITGLIIIDEMTMLSKHIFESINRSINEVTGSSDIFSGITTILGGDWRQCLPIVKHGNKAQILDECLISSPIWKKVELINFTQNVRAMLDPVYADLLLKVGNGDKSLYSTDQEGFIKLPEELFTKTDTIDELVSYVFPDIESTYKDIHYIANRAVICPTNSECQKINEFVLDKIPEVYVTYKSHDFTSDANSHLYPTEFLNTLEIPGFPPHNLKLKKNSVIMLLRNLNPLEGHMNGTKYVVNNLAPHVIDATSISPNNNGARIFIPRINMTAADNTLPFQFTRKAFPVKSAYAFTANKSQGHSLDFVGLYIEKEFFAHGQTYVAMSRVGSSKNIKILFKKDNNHSIQNIVMKEILNQLQ